MQFTVAIQLFLHFDTNITLTLFVSILIKLYSLDLTHFVYI